MIRSNTNEAMPIYANPSSAWRSLCVLGWSCQFGAARRIGRNFAVRTATDALQCRQNSRTIGPPTEHVAWKSKIPGVGWSQPIVWGDRVYVTTAVAEKQQRPKPGDWSPGDGIGGLSLIIGSVRKPPNVEYQLEGTLSRSGSRRTAVGTESRIPASRRFPVHPNNSYATETPVTDGERVIAYFGPAGIHCFDVSGKPQWNKELGSYAMQMDWGTASSPVLVWRTRVRAVRQR